MSSFAHALATLLDPADWPASASTVSATPAGRLVWGNTSGAWDAHSNLGAEEYIAHAGRSTTLSAFLEARAAIQGHAEEADPDDPGRNLSSAPAGGDIDEVYEQMVRTNEELAEANRLLAEMLEGFVGPGLQFKRLSADAKLPKRATDGAAGWDLFATQRVDLPPGKRLLLPTGIAMAIPPGWCGQIWPRSGMAVKEGADRLAGLVDFDYRGEVHVSLINHGEDVIEIKAGDRIAQLVVVPVLLEGVEVDELDDTSRGAGAFGSTGR